MCRIDYKVFAELKVKNHLEDGITVLVTGGRCYRDRARVFGYLDALWSTIGIDTVITRGESKGTGKFVADWCAERRVTMLAFRSGREQFGEVPMHVRNAEMLIHGAPHVVLAFPGEEETADVVAQAADAAVPTVEVPA